MDSSCLMYHVGKVQSIFSFPVNKKLFCYSVIALFHYSIFRVLQRPKEMGVLGFQQSPLTYTYLHGCSTVQGDGKQRDLLVVEVAAAQLSSYQVHGGELIPYILLGTCTLQPQPIS